MIFKYFDIQKYGYLNRPDYLSLLCRLSIYCFDKIRQQNTKAY